MKITVLLLPVFMAIATALPSATKRNPEMYNPETNNCDDCKARFDHCVKGAGVSGLPYCEAICRTRVKEGYGTVENASKKVCGSCDDGKYYPAGPLIKPQDKISKRSVRDGDAAFTGIIADAIAAEIVTRKEGLAALKELL